MKKIYLGFLLVIVMLMLPAFIFQAQAESRDEMLFPDYNEQSITGLIGQNDDEEYLPDYIPKLVEIIMKAISIIIFGMFIYSGVRFIYAGSDDEQLKESKVFFNYALIGLLCIILAYSLMKAIYYTLL